ncbi:MAG: hypothetical protein ACI9FR_001558 [Cryomorphaceae bacterium]|jgi:hypothetical protein
MTNDKRNISKLDNSPKYGPQKDSLKLSEQEVLNMPRARLSDSLGLQAKILSKTKTLEQTKPKVAAGKTKVSGSGVYSWLRPAYLGPGLLAVSLLFAVSLWLPLAPQLGSEPVKPIVSAVTIADLEFHDSLLLQDELLFEAL